MGLFKRKLTNDALKKDSPEESLDLKEYKCICNSARNIIGIYFDGPLEFDTFQEALDAKNNLCSNEENWCGIKNEIGEIECKKLLIIWYCRAKKHQKYYYLLSIVDHKKSMHSIKEFATENRIFIRDTCEKKKIFKNVDSYKIFTVNGKKKSL